jgi:hypothetical protein
MRSEIAVNENLFKVKAFDDKAKVITIARFETQNVLKGYKCK